MELSHVFGVFFLQKCQTLRGVLGPGTPVRSQVPVQGRQEVGRVPQHPVTQTKNQSNDNHVAMNDTLGKTTICRQKTVFKFLL